jgi:hypothetical protein
VFRRGEEKVACYPACATDPDAAFGPNQAAASAYKKSYELVANVIVAAEGLIRLGSWVAGRTAAEGAAILSRHAAEQAAARGITESEIKAAIEKGAQYSDRLHGTVSHVLSEGSGKTLVVARNPATNTVTTVMRRSGAFNVGSKLADGTARYVPIP